MHSEGRTGWEIGVEQSEWIGLCKARINGWKVGYLTFGKVLYTLG